MSHTQGQALAVPCGCASTLLLVMGIPRAASPLVAAEAAAGCPQTLLASRSHLLPCSAAVQDAGGARDSFSQLPLQGTCGQGWLGRSPGCCLLPRTVTSCTSRNWRS